MALKKYGNGSLLISIFCILGFLYSCSSSVSDNCYQLEEFAIDDNRLNSVMDSVLNKHLSAFKSTEEKLILTLNLSRKDTILQFQFSLRNPNDLIYRYIYRENKRIIGYTICDDTYIILLSDINNIAEFGEFFEHFIHPTGKTKKFSYMMFPKDLYKSGWPNYHIIYDPSYIIYKYVNNTFTSPVLTTNPDLDLRTQ